MCPVADEEKPIKVSDFRMFTPDGELKPEYRDLETAASTPPDPEPDPEPDPGPPPGPPAARRPPSRGPAGRGPRGGRLRRSRPLARDERLCGPRAACRAG